MKTARIRLTVAALSLTLVAAASIAWLGPFFRASGPAPEARRSVQAKAARVAASPRPFDSPDEAFAYNRAKRLGEEDGRIDSALAYARAKAGVQRMPRFVVRGGGLVEFELDRGSAATKQAAAAATAGSSAVWEWLGPGNVGGRTRTLAIHPRRPRIMYAGGVSGGVWKSRNRGRDWVPVGDQLANLAVNALAMDPKNPDTLYAGTGEGYFREAVRETSLPLRGGGVFKTTDGGATWELLEKTRKSAFQWVNDLVISPQDSDRIYAATRRGVYRSTSAGKRWKRVLKPRVLGGCLDLEITAAAGSDVVLASCGTLDQATVYRNRRAEDTRAWQSVLSEPGMGRTSLAIAPSNPSVVYALSASNVPGPGGNFEQALHAVFRSDDGGREGTWEARLRNTGGRKIDRLILSNPVIAFLEECGFEGPNRFFAMGWYVNLLAVDPRNADRVWAAGVDLFRSDDGGASFNPATYWWGNRGQPNSVHADHHAVVFQPGKGKRMYSLNDGGIYELRNPRAAIPEDPLTVCRPGSNGGSWTALNRNFGVTQFYHGATTRDGKRFLAGAQDNGTVLGGKASGPNGWVRVFGGDGGYSAIDPSDERILYVTFQNGQIRKSVDGGSNFSEAIAGISDLETNQEAGFRAVGPNFLFISPLVMDPNRSSRLWLGGRRLWRTDNSADEWSAASVPFASGGKVSAIAVAPGNSDRVVVGTDNGWIYRNEAATLASDAEDWTGVRPRPGFVSSVAFDPNATDTIYATYATFGGAHVWKSEDVGVSWVALDGNGDGALPDLPIHSVVVDPDRPDQIFLGSDLGVLVSADAGSTWGVGAGGLPAVVTESLHHRETPSGKRYLFAFTHGRGAWRLRLDR